MEHAVCAEHQNPASVICARCGSFLCPKCAWQTFCAACYRRGVPEEARVFRAQEWARGSWGAFLVSLGILLITRASLASILLMPLCWLAGIGAGVAALFVRRGAPGVIGPALIGIALNAASIVFALVVAR